MSCVDMYVLGHSAKDTRVHPTDNIRVSELAAAAQHQRAEYQPC